MSILKKDFISKRFFIGIIVFVLIILGFFSYKLYFLLKYNPSSLSEFSYEELVNTLDFKDTMVVNHRDLKKNEKYLTFENIKVKNDFDGYKEFLQNSDGNDYSSSYKLALYGENDEVLSSFWLTKYKTYVNVIRNSTSVDLYGLGENKKDDDFYRNVIIDNNINTDLELLDFLKNDKVKKVNIFSSVYDIKLLYSKTLFFTVALPVMNSLTKLEGDFNGYIVNMEHIKEVCIEKDGYGYALTFIDKDNRFDKEYINDILNTLVIGDE